MLFHVLGGSNAKTVSNPLLVVVERRKEESLEKETSQRQLHGAKPERAHLSVLATEYSYQ